MSLGDRAVELVLGGAETGLEVRAVLGYQVLGFLQLLPLVFELRLQLLVALVRRRAALAGPRSGSPLLLGGLLRLLRCHHIVQPALDCAELALQLIDGVAGYGLLGRKMPHRDLLPVTVTKCDARQHQQCYGGNHKHAVYGCPFRSPVFVLIFLMLFHPHPPKSLCSLRSFDQLPESRALAEEAYSV